MSFVIKFIRAFFPKMSVELPESIFVDNGFVLLNPSDEEVSDNTWTLIDVTQNSHPFHPLNPINVTSFDKIPIMLINY